MSSWSLSKDAKGFLTRFTIFLLVIPLSLLFLVRDVLGPTFSNNRNLIDGLAIVTAVVAVQLVLLWSCYEAFRPESDEKPGSKSE